MQIFEIKATGIWKIMYSNKTQLILLNIQLLQNFIGITI